MDRPSGGPGGARARPDGELRAAEAVFLAAGQRLHRLAVDAITGRAYDPDEYDTAVLDLRRARGQVRAVRVVWRHWQAQRAPRAPAAARYSTPTAPVATGRWGPDSRRASGTRSSAVAEPWPQTPEASSVEFPARPAAPAGAAPGDAGRAAREWWWAGRLMALHGFPVEHCPHRTPGAPQRRWRAGFASGTRVVASRGAPPA